MSNEVMFDSKFVEKSSGHDTDGSFQRALSCDSNVVSSGFKVKLYFGKGTRNDTDKLFGY